jgi:nucleoside-diphosphate-sugar epimerase
LVARSERVLITGATGFTGRLLAGRLRQNGQEVIAFSHGADGAGVRNIDLRDLHSLTQAFSQIRPSAVVHLAGIAATDHSDIGEIYSANVVGTANLFAALAVAKVEPQIVIVASSAQVYAAQNGAAPLTEDSPLAPQSHYAVSKRAAEDIARIYASRFPVIVTRPFNYTGPGQFSSFLVPKIVQHYAEGKSEIRLGNLDLFRDFSDVGRVVEVYYRLVSDAIEPDTVNICSGRSVRLADIPKILEEISGCTVEVITDPSLFRRDEPHIIAGSPSRLEKLVGPLPNPEFRETLFEMYKMSRLALSGRYV